MKPLIDPCKPMVGMGRDIGSGGERELGLVLMPLPDVASKFDVEIGTEVHEMGISWTCWFLLLMITVSFTQSQGCPQRCECFAKLKTVSCYGKRLSALPDGIPSDTKILDLSGNKLRWVEHGDLLPYPRLEKLDLSDNMISVLEPNAFSSLQNLQSLSLRGNQLKLVPMGAFSRLSNLTSLDLSGNKIVILLDFTENDKCKFFLNAGTDTYKLSLTQNMNHKILKLRI